MPESWFEWREAPPGRFAVIGDPIAHSMSPQMQSAALRSLGEEGEYHAIRVTSEEFYEAVEHLISLGYQGVNVTVPLKQVAAGHIAAMPFALRCGSVNCIDLQRKIGTNTDGMGFLETLQGRSFQQVLLLGAGGSARAIALAIALAGYPLRVFNRTRSKAASMIEELGIEATLEDTPRLEDVDLVVNATAASMTNSDLNLWSAGVPSAPVGALAYDLYFGDTRFLEEARGCGWETMDGKPMLAHQGALSLEFWLGKKPDSAILLEAIQ